MKQKFLACVIQGAFLKPVFYNGNTSTPVVLENQSEVDTYLANTGFNVVVIVPIYVQ